MKLKKLNNLKNKNKEIIKLDKEKNIIRIQDVETNENIATVDYKINPLGALTLLLQHNFIIRKGDRNAD